MKIEFHYTEDGKDVVKTYEGMEYEQALEKFHSEFSEKPDVNQIKIDKNSGKDIE